MQQQIDNLQKQIDELKRQLTNSGMPTELRELIRNEVVKDTNTDAPPTETVTMEVGQEITFPDSTKLKTIIIKWQSKEYNVLYYENI